MRWLLVLLLIVSSLPAMSQDYSRIDRWTDQYSAASKDFLDSFVALEKEPKQWEMSYEIILRRFRRTAEAAAGAVSSLRRLNLPPGPEGVWDTLRSKLPSWADHYAEVNRVQQLHQTTIEAVSNIQKEAEEGIRDVQNAGGRPLFQNAISRYQEKAKAESDKLESATKQLSPRTRTRLGNCTANLIGSH